MAVSDRPAPGSRIRFGVYELDLETRELRKSGISVHLPPQPAQVLILLTSRAGELVLREEIREEIWGNETFVDFETGLNHCINQIRTALRDDAAVPRYVQTVPRRGYRFIAPVEKCSPAVVAAGVSRRPAFLAAAPLLVALIAASGLALWGVRQSWPPAGAPRVATVAVLPFENLTGDPDQEYFVDGMTEALIARLSKISALHVTSRTSVMQYKTARKPLPAIARELGVEAVLEGSVAREGPRVRVTTQLIDAARDRHLWADTFEYELSGVLAFQSQVARAVTAGVEVQLLPREQTQLANVRQVNPTSYEAYLRGMYHINRSTNADTRKGLEYLHEAVARDPADPLAYAGLALGYVKIAHSAEASEDSLHRAKAAAQTALRLDPSLAEAASALGQVQGYLEWDWANAFDNIGRALEANPSLAIAYYHRAWFHALFGRMDEAIDDHLKAQRLDPFNPLHTAWLGELYLWQGRRKEAREQADRAIQMAPGFPVGYFVIARQQLEDRDYGGAISTLRRLAEITPNYRWALGPAYAAAGRLDEARQILAELERQPLIPWNAFWRMNIHAALGELDEAFRWLEFQPHHAWLAWVRVLPWAGLERLYGDPRFAGALRRMNLPPLKQPAS